jgi:hypothetical protein
MNIEHISYPASVIETRFKRYWKSLPPEVRKKLDKDSVEQAYTVGFEDVPIYVMLRK